MNKIFKTLIIVSALFTITLTSCKDDEVVDPPKVADVEFTFTHPEAAKMYGKGDTVHIAGMMKWENELHGYELTLKNETHDSVVYTAHHHEDTKMLHVHQMWINTVTQHSNMSLTIDALTDHDGAKQTKVINFHCHPM